MSAIMKVQQLFKLIQLLSCSAVVLWLTGMSVFPDLSHDLFTCPQVSFAHFPPWSLTMENGSSNAQRGPVLVKGLPVEGLLEKGVLSACYVTRRGDRPEEGEGLSVGWRVKAQNNGSSQVGRAHQLSVLSCNFRKWILVKLVSS